VSGAASELFDGDKDINSSVVGWNGAPGNPGSFHTLTIDLGGVYDVQTIDLSARNSNGTVNSIDVSVSTDGVSYSTPVNFVPSWSGSNPAADTLNVAALGDARYYRLYLVSNDWAMLTEVEFYGVATGPGGNDFSDWIAGFSVGGQTGIGDDPDLDGVDSGVENFFGTAPDSFTQGLVSGTVSGNTFTFTHPLNATPADDLTAVYRWSTDLQDFYDDGDPNGAGTTTVDFAQGTPSGGMVTVTATISGTVIPDTLFVDVEVTQN